MTDHDARHDISNEMWCVASELFTAGLVKESHDLQGHAVDCMNGEGSLVFHMKKLGHFENLIDY